MPCASWGPWGPPTGLYGVSANFLGLPDAEYLINWDLTPTRPLHQHQGPKGVGHVHLGPLGNHLQGHFGVSVYLLGLTDAQYLI